MSQLPWGTIAGEVRELLNEHLTSWKRCVGKHLRKAVADFGGWDHRDISEWMWQISRPGSENDFEPDLSLLHANSAYWQRVNVSDFAAGEFTSAARQSPTSARPDAAVRLAILSALAASQSPVRASMLLKLIEASGLEISERKLRDVLKLMLSDGGDATVERIGGKHGKGGHVITDKGRIEYEHAVPRLFAKK